MKKQKEVKKNMLVQKTILVILLLGLWTQFVVWFVARYEFQAPIKFQSPIRERHLKPVPDKPVPTTRPELRGLDVTPTATPTLTPTKKPVKRTTEGEKGIVGKVYAAEHAPSDAEIIAYIESKDWDDKVAVALAKSENFWNLTKSFDCGRVGKMNSNGTYDTGLWQINSIHINSGAITLEDAKDCYKATDFAYGLYKGRGNTFNAWSAYKNGSYLNHL